MVSIQEVHMIHLLGAAVSRNSFKEYSTQQVQVAWEEETHLLCTFTDKRHKGMCRLFLSHCLLRDCVHAKTWMLAAAATQNSPSFKTHPEWEPI